MAESHEMSLAWGGCGNECCCAQVLGFWVSPVRGANASSVCCDVVCLLAVRLRAHASSYDRSRATVPILSALPEIHDSCVGQVCVCNVGFQMFYKCMRNGYVWSSVLVQVCIVVNGSCPYMFGLDVWHTCGLKLGCVCVAGVWSGIVRRICLVARVVCVSVCCVGLPT